MPAEGGTAPTTPPFFLAPPYILNIILYDFLGRGHKGISVVSYNMEEWVMTTIRGRPSLWILQQKYKPLEKTESIDETWVGRECIVIYRYPKKVAGNWHQNVLYYGRFSPGSYETHIWIKDYNGHKGRISKSRLVGPRFVIYILKYKPL